MWKELRERIETRVGERSLSRRMGLSRRRCQFEQLETRTVLSASLGPSAAIGVMAVGIEAGTITFAVWESRPQLTEPTRVAALRTANQSFMPPFEGALSIRAPVAAKFAGHDEVFAQFSHGLGSYGYIDHGGTSLRLPPFGDGNLGDGEAISNLGEIVDFESIGGKGGDGPLMAHSPEPEPGGVRDTTQITSNLNNPNAGRPDLRPPLRVVTIPLPSFSAVLEAASGNDILPTKTPLVRDAAFGEYSSGSLLLAASVDGDVDDDRLRLGDDERDADEKAAESDNETTLDLVRRDATESLDALEREQAAIDAVLAKLHDLKLNQEQPSTDTTRPHNHAKSNRLYQSADDYLPTDERGIADANFRQADGGMVLLVPTGDANSSAYDLTIVFTGKFARPHDVALGLEATVGLQQAFDVGSNERFESLGTRVPGAQPAASTQPSISAENASAKKSEQPS